MRMLRGVGVPCWRDVAGLAAAPFEARGADSVIWFTGVISWLRHREIQPELSLSTTQTLTAEVKTISVA